MRKIEIRIKKGEVAVDLNGFRGGECDRVVEGIERQLKERPVENRKKPEYFEDAKARVRA
jgi:hypothetical protein